MKLAADEVKKIALLARIDLTASEITKFQTQLSEVIDFNAKQLSKITQKVSSKLEAGQGLGQPDQPRPSLEVEQALANAPIAERGFFVVPKVFGP